MAYSMRLLKLNYILMKTTFGVILLIIGLVTTLITGMNAVQQTETFSFLGMDVVVSQGNYSPVIISALVLVMGVVLLVSARGK
jgi:hypothetical protein